MVTHSVWSSDLLALLLHDSLTGHYVVFHRVNLLQRLALGLVLCAGQTK